MTLAQWMDLRRGPALHAGGRVQYYGTALSGFGRSISSSGSLRNFALRNDTPSHTALPLRPFVWMILLVAPESIASIMAIYPTVDHHHGHGQACLYALYSYLPS